MERKLSQEQIGQLFNFTKKKFVHFYDLQLELVDHLASSIEEEMDADNSISFEHALQKVYNRFGIFGFAKVVQERSDALVKYNKRIWRHEVKNFFTLPKIILTLVIFLAFLLSGRIFSPDAKGAILLGAWIAITVPIMISFFKSKNKEAKKLLLTQYTPYSTIPGFVIPYSVAVIGQMEIHSNLAFSVLMVILIISESAVFIVNENVRKKALQLYPEAFKTA